MEVVGFVVKSCWCVMKGCGGGGLLVGDLVMGRARLSRCCCWSGSGVGWWNCRVGFW